MCDPGAIKTRTPLLEQEGVARSAGVVAKSNFSLTTATTPRGLRFAIPLPSSASVPSKSITPYRLELCHAGKLTGRR